MSAESIADPEENDLGTSRRIAGAMIQSGSAGVRNGPGNNTSREADASQPSHFRAATGGTSRLTERQSE